MTKNRQLAMMLALCLASCAALAVESGRPAESTAALPAGKVVFDHWCAGCHEALPGRGIDPPAGTFVLQQRYRGAVPAELEKRTNLPPEYIRALVRTGRNIMTPFRKTEVTDRDLDALVAWLTRNNPKEARQ
ncbi:c-type cytochrome [Burkholderia sp. MR1-5-21]